MPQFGGASGVFQALTFSVHIYVAALLLFANNRSLLIRRSGTFRSRREVLTPAKLIHYLEISKKFISNSSNILFNI